MNPEPLCDVGHRGPAGWYGATVPTARRRISSARRKQRAKPSGLRQATAITVSERAKTGPASPRFEEGVRRLFNSFFDEYEPGDFVVHFAGCSQELKLAGVKIIVDSVRSGAKPSSTTKKRKSRIVS